MLTEQAPAKLNLTLEVLGRRADGYHEIKSIVQTISLRDHLTFAPAPAVEFNCDMPGWQAERSLVSRAARLLQEATGCPWGASIGLKKRIPLMSGLGGDSSDAAAVLRGLARLWELELPQEKLLSLAVQLGSDVPFFLAGGTALMEGRGERLTPLPPLRRAWFVLVLPTTRPEAGKTQRAYSSLTQEDYTDGSATQVMTQALRAGGEVTQAMLYNAFERAAFGASPELSTLRQRMLAAGASHVHLAGSGPTLYTMSGDRSSAEALGHRLRALEIDCRVAQAVPGPGW